MRRWIGTLAVGLMVLAAILVLDPSLTPGWLRTWLGREDGSSGSTTALGLLPNPEITGDQKVGTTPGAFAPDFSLKSLDGRVIRLSDYRGKRKVLINFWASWCGPCQAEMPDLEAVYRQHRDQLVVLGIDLQEGPAAIEKFLDDLRKEGTTISYPILLDPDGQVKNGYNVFAQPASYFVDEQGRIWGNKYGAFTSDELKQRVAQFLETSFSGERLPDQGGAPTYKIGNLTGLYFSPYELKMLGLEGDPTSVRYLASLKVSALQTQLNPDSIPAIDHPVFEAVSQANRWLHDEDLVLTLVDHDIVKAYPIRILNWHEIVNDQLGDLPVVVTFCPLCGSGIVFERPVIEGKLTTFGTSGRLYQSDLVMYDRVTGSFWSQIEGRPIAGPLVGRFGRLQTVPANLSPWGAWKVAYPQTLVLARPTITINVPLAGGHPHSQPQPVDEFPRDYDINIENMSVTITIPLVPFTDQRLHSKAIVSGLVIGDHAKAYRKEAVRRVGLINDDLGGMPILVLWDPQLQDALFFFRTLAGEDRPLTFTLQGGRLIDQETGTIWGFDGQARSGVLAARQARLEPLTGITAFWFAWLAFHPKTTLYAP